MNRKVFYSVLFFAAFSLIGTVFTQVFWVKNAVLYKQEQFDNKVCIALKSIVNRLLLTRSDSTVRNSLNCKSSCELLNEKNIPDEINLILLDTLVKEELNNLEINYYYEYGIICQNSKKLLYSSGRLYSEELLHTRHLSSLTCLYTDESLVLGIYFPDEPAYIFYKLLLWLCLSVIFIIIIVISFVYTVYSYIKQKKLTAIKNDFINNMTHELKTPISTISLTSEMLLQEEIFNKPESVKKYARVIFDENQRLQTHVEQVLQTALMGKRKLDLKLSETDIHQLINENINRIKPLLRTKNGSIKFEAAADTYIINADKVLINTVMLNLLDNACKYSINNPKIYIKTWNFNDKMFIIIEDKGIGISKEYLEDIFKEFYRIPTGNLHDVKGFGLGLYFVKSIVEAHGGTVKVKSELNKGSRFEIVLPISK